MKISVSILGLKEKTKDEIQKLEACNIDYIHIDVMDGNFVSNTSFPYNEVAKIVDNFKYDVHLMIQDVEKYIDEFVNIKPEYITFHLEINKTKELIEYLKQKQIKVGIAVNPDTDIEKIYPYLKDIDLVLVMSVKPGLGGQKFIEESLLKIDKLYDYRTKNNLSFKISVDGGVNDQNFQSLKKCDIVVIGSYITNGNYEEKIERLRGE